MTDKPVTDPIPEWLDVTAERVIVTLSRPTETNGVMVQRIEMRTPTMDDLALAEKQEPNTKSREYDKIVFASLAGIGVNDLGKLSVRDYNRVREGYFRMVEED